MLDNDLRKYETKTKEARKQKRRSDLRERDAELIENWYVACLSKDLKKEKPVRSVIYDTPIVVVRTKENKVHAFEDRCLHRAAQLSKGEMKDGCLTCPYHGWQYNMKGEVEKVPSEGECTKSRDWKLRNFNAYEQDGCIWVYMGEKTKPKSPPPFRFPNFEKKGWGFYYMKTDFDNEVTHLAENFVDVPHTVFVHKGWFRDEKALKVPIALDVKDGEVCVTYEQEADEIGFTGRILNPKGEKMTHTDRFILPNVTRVDYKFGEERQFIIISQITPVSRLKSRVYTAIIYKLGAFTKPLTPFFKFYTRQVIEQDVDIMANQAENLELEIEPPFKATQADIVHVAIERLRDWARNGDPKAFSHNLHKKTDIWI